jgi:hypothetical protein
MANPSVWYSVIELSSDFIVNVWGCAVLLEDETGTQKALLSSMAAIFSHIAHGGEQCYYAAAQHKLSEFLFPSVPVLCI